MNSETYTSVKAADKADHAGSGAPTLTASDFAFMRALLQGIDAQTCWSRYLGTHDAPGTTQNIQRTIDRIRNAFEVAYKQHQRPGTAHLLRLTVANKHVLAPGLTDFVMANALDGFSEAEQLTLYAQQFGASSRKHARLVARQLEALNWLQRVIPAMDAQQTMIADWLEPRLAERLATAGLVRTADLCNLMQRRADRWWCGVAQIGAIKAARVVASMPLWQSQDGDRRIGGRKGDGPWPGSDQPGSNSANPMGSATGIATGTELGSSAELIAPQIAPLRSQARILSADGMCGGWRARPCGCRIAATNDFEAVRCWLQVGVRQRGTLIDQTPAGSVVPGRAPISSVEAAAKRPGRSTALDGASLPVPGWDLLDRLSNTQRAYWKEAERFLLWLIIERCTTLSALTEQDCSAYEAFLRAPGRRWCGPRGRGKDHPLWRPFEGPLGPPAQAHTVGVLRCLYRFLVAQGYRAASPWENAGDARAVPVLQGLECSSPGFDADAWRVIAQVQRQLAPTSSNCRLQVAILLLRSSGARLGELVRASVDDLEAPLKPHRAWLLHLRGAHGSVRSVSLHPDAVRLLKAYFTTRGLDGVLQAPANHGARLLGKATDAPQRAPWAPCAKTIDPRSGIGLGTMADQLRAFFQLCAQACSDNPVLATHFSRANSHWLRGGPTPRQVQQSQVAGA